MINVRGFNFIEDYGARLNLEHIDNLQGDGTVTFVFLPGSSFDMKGFRFE